MLKTKACIFILISFAIVDFGNGECCFTCILDDTEAGYCQDCTRAAPFSCCGIGACNIFCCNCDYGICIPGTCCAGFSFLNYHQQSNKSSAEMILDNLDKNKDQKLSFEEIDARYGSHYDLKVEFPLLDKNNDGFITVDEIDSDAQKAKAKI